MFTSFFTQAAFTGFWASVGGLIWTLIQGVIGVLNGTPTA